MVFGTTTMHVAVLLLLLLLLSAAACNLLLPELDAKQHKPYAAAQFS